MLYYFADLARRPTSSRCRPFTSSPGDVPTMYRSNSIRNLILTATAAVLVGVAMLWALDPEAASGPLPKLRPARDTTFLIAPLDDEGRVDYAAALNSVYGQDIAANENMLVALWHAWGPNALSSPLPDEYFQRLEMKPPPEKGVYLVGFSTYAREASGGDDEVSDRFHENFSTALSQPWTSRRLPEIAAWTTMNEAALAKATAAARLPKYYRPIVDPADAVRRPLMFVIAPPEAGLLRDLGRLLVCRANLHVGEQRYRAAAGDLLTCRRLARLVARGPSQDDAVIGFVVDASAIDAERVLFQTGGLTAADWRYYLDELKKLQPLPPPADMVNRTDRFLYLDIVQRVRDQAPGALPSAWSMKNPARAARIDFEAALRDGNRWFDRLTGARRRLRFDAPMGQAQLTKLSEELAAMRRKFAEREQAEGSVVDLIADDEFSDFCRASWINDRYLAPYGIFERQEQELELSKAAAATALFRAERGRYPDGLEELGTLEFKARMRDQFTGAPLVYHREADGCVIYSLGPNGRDDGGVNKTDRLDHFDERFDDRVVRIMTPTK